MIRFEKLASTESVYPFVDAVVAADYKNGTFGTITDGTFTSGNGFMAVMQVEAGDAAKTDSYTVFAGEHARIADFSKVDGHVVNITKDQLPETYKVGDKLVGNGATYTVGEASNKCFEVIEVMPYGVRAIIVA
jgi:hypothetical protein